MKQTEPTDPAALADLIDELRRAAYPGRWYAEDSGDWWELYAENMVELDDGSTEHLHPLKIAKCEKNSHGRIAEYWPRPEEEALILGLVNAAPLICQHLRSLTKLRELLVTVAPGWMQDPDERDNEGNYIGPSKVYLETDELRLLQAYFSTASPAPGKEGGR